MGQTASTSSPGQPEPIQTNNESNTLKSTSVSSDDKISTLRPVGVNEPVDTKHSSTPEQLPSIVPHTLDTWFKDLLTKLGSTPSDMYVICSDVVLGTAFDFETAKAYTQQEAKRQLTKGMYRYKVELHRKSDMLPYLITVYERNPNLIFGQSVMVVQYSVWKVPIFKTIV
jgi:hypothetical protein